MVIPEIKFSLWADFIERDFLDKGFKELIDRGIVNGATSNPAIFKEAILNSPAYRLQLADMEGLSAKEKYEALAIFDIQKAADVLRPLFDAGNDGYVSIEVDPYLCDDTHSSIEEGKRLYAAIDRPNVMIKVPATEAGYLAMEALVSGGIPVNATLVFSKEQAVNCVRAFEKGIENYGKKVDTVVSVFVSRIDRALDDTLRHHGLPAGLAGIYNAAAIYDAVEAMQVPGCRTLFASTGVKGDDLRPSYYVEELLARNSVNTAPLATVDAFVASRSRDVKLPIDAKVIEKLFASIEKAGIDFDDVVANQIENGLDAFKTAFKAILDELG